MDHGDRGNSQVRRGARQSMFAWCLGLLPCGEFCGNMAASSCGFERAASGNATLVDGQGTNGEKKGATVVVMNHGPGACLWPASSPGGRGCPSRCKRGSLELNGSRKPFDAQMRSSMAATPQSSLDCPSQVRFVSSSDLWYEENVAAEATTRRSGKRPDVSPVSASPCVTTVMTAIHGDNMTETTTTMRAWVFTERGDPSNVLQFTTLEKPTLPPRLPLPRDAPVPEEWVLIKTAFVGLNVGAIFQMTLIPQMLRTKTCVPEMDLSGVVEDVWHPEPPAAGSGTCTSSTTPKPFRFSKGVKVVAMLSASHALATGTGALAEYVAVPAKYVARKADSVSFGDAAGCLLAGMTAWQQVHESGAKEGDRVLVNAASGGIGTMVVQMVRNIVGDAGYVAGICSGKNVELVKSLGADEVQKACPSHYVFGNRPFNAIIDTLGHQSLYLGSPAYLVPGGVYSSAGIKPPSFAVPHFLRAVVQMKLNEWWPVSRWLGGVGRLWRGVSMMEPTLEDRQRIVGLLGRGEVRVVRDSVWPFEDAQAAYAHLAGLHARGKVLVKVNAELGDDEA
ncbi:zinc alcohol dehydrogenase [Cordyceps militaris CM01]|uniref:Zinc alcohol dehydrogenase n=1 Tax=Cordyceps militaris (strain CM01) TaxID=983644 RepID=G3JC75_CORMM|nr:zinc alcohol dehydrogenase [Cordyceps militaris CM01]EGX94590.1 zinc alcohol dehydrogenase [Cordyceps militaris CM01]